MPNSANEEVTKSPKESRPTLPTTLEPTPCG